MTAVLSVAGISRWYHRGSVRVDVLCGADVELAAGDFVAVWGRLGSGKTTLLRLAAGLERPDEGVVRFEGRDLAGLSRRAMQRLRRHDIGFATRSGPFDRQLTAQDHVAFPLMGTLPRPEANRRAMATLRELGVEAACATMRWGELTDGERTLVSIAHAVVREPKLLLVDDPTSNLGVHERERTVALLHRFAAERQVAVLMTAPDMAATLGAHEVFTLSDGKLLAAGPPPQHNVIRLTGA
jgi:ABC-type lipoprotein export system ATPase subunit